MKAVHTARSYTSGKTLFEENYTERGKLRGNGKSGKVFKTPSNLTETLSKISLLSSIPDIIIRNCVNKCWSLAEESEEKMPSLTMYLRDF